MAINSATPVRRKAVQPGVDDAIATALELASALHRVGAIEARMVRDIARLSQNKAIGN